MRDGAAQFYITPNGTGIGAGLQAIITFGHPYTSRPVCVVTPVNLDAATNISAFGTANNANEIDIYFANPPVAGTRYEFAYHCMAVR